MLIPMLNRQSSWNAPEVISLNTSTKMCIRDRLDLSFATIRIEDGVNVFFTAEEWNSLSANNRSKYLRIGCLLYTSYFKPGDIYEFAFVIEKANAEEDGKGYIKPVSYTHLDVYKRQS